MGACVARLATPHPLDVVEVGVGEEDRGDLQVPSPHHGKRVGSGGAGVDEQCGAPVVTDHEQGVLNECAAREGEDLHAHAAAPGRGSPTP